MNEGEKITAEMLPPEMVQRYPATPAVLDRYGLQGCGGRWDRMNRFRGLPITLKLYSS
jgi:hypothetical protein